MWFILAGSLIAVIIFFERFLSLHRTHIKTDDFLKGIYNILKKGNFVEAISICEETPGPVAHIVRTAVLYHDKSREEMRRMVVESGREEIPRLERNLAMLATIGKITPLLGLLGTIIGMISSLIIIDQKAPLIHSGDLASGLWQALISTAAGLVVAIPTYAGYNLLITRIETIVLDMERAASDIVSFFTTNLLHKTPMVKKREPDRAAHI